MVDKEYYNDMLLESEEYQELIKEYGTISTHIETYRLFDDDYDVPSYESCVIVKIENGNVYYDDNVCDDLDALSMNELYNIISNL